MLSKHRWDNSAPESGCGERLVSRASRGIERGSIFENDAEHLHFPALLEALPQRILLAYVRGGGCFKLPLSDGNFYPDFAARLKDGRILVVEYKGAHLEAGEQEKRDVGRLWQERSGGQSSYGP